MGGAVHSSACGLDGVPRSGRPARFPPAIALQSLLARTQNSERRPEAEVDQGSFCGCSKIRFVMLVVVGLCGTEGRLIPIKVRSDEYSGTYFLKNLLCRSQKGLRRF